MASHTDFTDDEDELFSYDEEEKDSSCWCEFSVQSELTSRECKEWTCIPMLWLDVLVEVDPSTLPISFSKAVVWAMSHFSLVEPVSIVPMELPLSDWLSSHAGEILCSFRWEVPKGSDDGGDGRDSKNSVKASSMCIPLIRTFKRCAANFVIQMEKRELQKQWTWEPRMAESLILSLIDPNDTVRQADRIILEHVSKTRGLTPGLQFLCSSASSLSAMYLGLKYALKQVQLDSSLVNFHNLHHLFFVVRKLLKEVVAFPQKSNVIFKEDTNCSKFSGEGGFLRQPCFDHSPVTASCSSNVVDRKSWEKFSCMLSAIMWPAVLKCLVKGKEFFDNKSCQMTCVRLLETVPVLFERISLSASNLPRNLEILLSGIFDLKWLPDLVDWGRSSLMVITRHWKQAMLSLLDLIKGSSNVSMTCTIDTIEARTSFDAVAVAELKDRVSQLSVSLSKEAGQPVQGKSLKAKSLLFEPSSFGRKSSPGGISSSEDKDSHIQDTPVVFKSRGEDKVIVLSDDEMEKVSSPDVVILSSSNSSRHRLVQESAGNNGISLVDDNVESVSARVSSSILQPFSRSEVIGYSGLTYQKQDNDVLGKAQPPSEASSSTVAPINSKCDSVTHRKDDPHDSRSLRKADAPPNDSSDRSVYHGNLDQASSIGRANIEPQKKDDFIKELIHDAEDDDDPWEFAIKSAKHHQSQQTKPCLTVPKRKLIQLAMPMNNKSGHPSRMDIGVRRLKPPRLDDWYKPILEIDYFSIVGLSSENNDENATATNLKEVPLCFHSPDHYIEIFRPLVLEEFKAQLHNSYLEASSSDEMYCGSVCILSVERIDDFHLVRGRPEDCESAARTCSENDLVLLTKEPLQNSAQHLHVVGKVERREKSDKSRSIILVIRFYLNNGSSRLNRVKRLLIERSKWYVSRVMSITPQLREFQALSSLSDITMLPTILEPTDCAASFTETKKVELDRLSQHMQIMLRSSFNNSQLQAIDAAIGTQGSKRTFKLSLIQGPPGTGKTRTIVAILSAMLALGPLRKGDASKILGNCSRQDSACSNSRAQISQSAAIARAWQNAAFAKQMIKDGETHSSGSVECPARGRVLICAQSNAAVDELVSRIKDGLYGNDGKMYRPYLVRVGNAKTVHPNSLPFFIDTLVEQRLKEDKTETDAKHEMSVDSPVSLRTKLEKLVDSIRFYESKRAKLRDYDMDTKTSSENELSEVNDENELSDAAIGAKLNMLYGQKRTVCADLAAAQAREKKIYEESKFLKQKIRKSILREAEIVMTTLSGCGGDIYGVCFNSSSHGRFGQFSESSLFDAVVIDEAAQALEPATLIPLQLLRSNGTKCIMVGDPKQLPATVLSNVASKFLYECSMFERLQRAGHPVIMLTEQYRMHPEICKFPSLHFYENKLLNGIQMSSKSAPFHECVYLGPYVFFDIVDGRERHGKNSRSVSLYNESEADAAIEIMKFFKKRYFSEFAAGRVGIITPYKSQLSLLRSRSTSELGPNTTADMEFNTVDGFQGREVDILILSTVRASDPNARAPGSNSSNIGFVADVRRMNVALTRAKLSLWIVGNARTLQTNLHWAALIKNAQERDLFVSLSSPYIFEKPSSLSKKKLNSDANLWDQHPGEKVKNVRHDADTNVVAKEDNKGKTKPIYGEQERCKFRHMSDCVSNKVDGKQMVSSATDFSSCGVVRQDHRSSKLVESTMRRHPARKPEGKHNDSQGKKDESSGMRHNLKKKPMHNQVEGKVIQAKRKLEKDSDIKTLIKEAKEAVEPLEHSSSSNFSKRRSEVSQSFTEEKDSDGKGEVANPDDSSKDLIAIRKRQRDAVDALLSSALISSKRPEISLKSAPNKRPISPNAAGDAIKPSRASKGKGTGERKAVCSTAFTERERKVVCSTTFTERYLFNGDKFILSNNFE